MIALALPGADGATTSAADSNIPLADRVAEFERATIVREIKKHGGHITNSAKALGLKRSHLYKKREQPGIDLANVRKEEDAKGGAAK